MNLQFLQNVELFQELSEAELQKISLIGALTVHPADTVIFNQGDDAHSLYIILEGFVRITRHIDEMEELLVIMKPGDYFGEMALVEDTPRSAKAATVQSVSVLEISKRHLFELLDQDDRLAKKLLWQFARILSRRLRGLHNKLENLFTFTHIC